MVVKNLVDKLNWIINVDEIGIILYYVLYSVLLLMFLIKVIIIVGSVIGIYIRVRCLFFLRKCIFKIWIVFGFVWMVCMLNILRRFYVNI